MKTEGMMPEQTPYMPDERAQLDSLLRDACEAEELFTLEELEWFASHPHEEEDNV